MTIAKVTKTKVYLSVFTSGFVLMVFEIVGSRVVAPFLGSSLVVWTSIIGVILGFMSFGYWYGGKTADKFPTIERLATVLVYTSAAILILNLGKNYVLKMVSDLPLGLVIKSLLSCTILFSVPSFFLAFVTPFAIRLNIVGVTNSGETAGTVYALSTAGSIIGTFLSGFVMISLFGTNQILWTLSCILFILAGFIAWPTLKNYLFWIILLFIGNLYYSLSDSEYLDIDTDYSRVFVWDETDLKPNSKFMSINGHINSGMYIDNPNTLVYKYTEYYDLIDFFNPTWKSVVMFGGGAYSYPKHFQETFKERNLDVVEIDPRQTEIAVNHFSFVKSPSTKIFHEDARYFLSQCQNKYDGVLYDVLTSDLTVPFHLTTMECFEAVSEILNDNGVFILNIIGDLNGRGSMFIKSEIKTLQHVFPQVHVFDVKGKDNKGPTNYIIVALKSSKGVNFITENDRFNKLLMSKLDLAVNNQGLLLTDNYAPANYLIFR